MQEEAGGSVIGFLIFVAVAGFIVWKSGIWAKVQGMISKDENAPEE